MKRDFLTMLLSYTGLGLVVFFAGNTEAQVMKPQLQINTKCDHQHKVHEPHNRIPLINPKPLKP